MSAPVIHGAPKSQGGCAGVLAALPTIRMDDQAYGRRPVPVIEGDANTTTT